MNAVLTIGKRAVTGALCAAAIAACAAPTALAASPPSAATLKRVFRAHHKGLRIAGVMRGLHHVSAVVWTRPAAHGSPEAAHHAFAGGGEAFYRGTHQVAPSRSVFTAVGEPAGAWVGVLDGTGQYVSHAYQTTFDDDGNPTGTEQSRGENDSFHVHADIGPDDITQRENSFSIPVVTSSGGTAQVSDVDSGDCTSPLTDPNAENSYFDYRARGPRTVTGRTELLRLRLEELESTGSCFAFVPGFEATGTVNVPAGAWHTFDAQLNFSKTTHSDTPSDTAETFDGKATFYLVGFDFRSVAF